MEQTRLAVGLLAHVDAGKTTLAECMLYLSGAIRELGRVDHKTAFLDTFELERQRGITIFSKQAQFELGNISVTLLDTPGHVDFSAEAERTIQVLDYAILVINSMDGVQGHTLTLWSLLKKYEVPVFLFINKMDQFDLDTTDRKEWLLENLSRRLDEGCLDFLAESRVSFYEALAMCDESVMNQYLETDKIAHKDIVKLIKNRKVFPCYFGSALKTDGVNELLIGLEKYTESSLYMSEFGARVFKISRDTKGERLTFLKVTGGSLKVKIQLCEAKVNQIRIYSGEQYQTISEAPAGTICAVTGLDKSYAGEGLGAEKTPASPVLEPILTYHLILPTDCDVHEMLKKMLQLEEEEPLLHITWDEHAEVIQVKVMGEIQIEIIKSLILERFGEEVDFGSGSIVYKESIVGPVVGSGHFEPLRHYAEVHLLMEPGEPGSGMQFASICSEDILDRNWKSLIMTHLQEKKYRGVLTGSEITDIRITLTAGKAHLKHTEGGDFRQATYRAVCQGLRKAEGILLEPVYEYRLEVPIEKTGRALSDIQKMSGYFSAPISEGNMTIIEGTAPVSEMRAYPTEVAAYTRGEGRIFCSLSGYERCHNAEDIIEQMGYNPDKDLEHTADSVFCSHGAGFTVSWEEAERYMHVDSGVKFTPESSVRDMDEMPGNGHTQSFPISYNEEELEEIFVRTYGPIKRNQGLGESNLVGKRRDGGKGKEYVYRKKESVEEYLLVDGYNIIFAWDELKELAKDNLSSARDKLCDILCNYQGFKKITVILVFDAYKVQGFQGEIQEYHNIHIVYTKEAETADQYIEKTVRKIAKKNKVTVATSDALEQLIIFGYGATRLSAAGLKEEVEVVNKEIRRILTKADYL